MPARYRHTLGCDYDGRDPSPDWPVRSDVGPGLRGAVATTTRVVWLDRASGRLSYRGVPIEALAQGGDFERVSFLLLAGTSAEDDPPGFVRFKDRLRSSRRLPPDVVRLIRDLSPDVHPTRLLRAGVSALGCHELSAADDLAGERHWRALRIVGQTVGLLGEILRHRRGAPSEPADAQASLAASALLALRGRPPEPEETEALDLLWVLYASHGLDAPTFTSMVVASCLADPYYNVVAGLSALRGPRQGGAGEDVLSALLGLDGPAAAERWVRRTLAEGRVLAGFGHRAYRTPDPRVPILREATAAFARRRGREDLLEVALAVERAATPRLSPKGVYVNVNFYAALLFHLLGADPPAVPCLVAVARMAGMVALVREALPNIRLYRPLSRYVGVSERSMAAGRPS